MKVVIELLGTESKEDLLATSNYLRELAGETSPVMVEKKTDPDKLADAVVEATKVRREAAPVKTVSEYIAEERAKNRASRTKNVEAPAPAEAPAEAPAPAPAEAPAPKSPKCDAINYSIDDCKQWAMKALNAKKRPIVQEAFEHVGATSFPTLKEDMFYNFVDYIATRL
nr:MAG TPA: hypothetical protein [Caudoviricetes sp.]